MEVSGILSFASGVLVPLQTVFAAIVAVLLGTPFTSEPYRYDTVPPRGAVLQTSRCVVIFEGLEIGSGGGGYLTVSGRHGLIPRFWDGYAEGEHAHTEHRILPDGSVSKEGVRRAFRLRYDPQQGIAKLHFYGKMLTIEEEARKLRINGKIMSLPKPKALQPVRGKGFDGNMSLWELPQGRTVIVVDRAGRPREGRPEDFQALRKQMEKNMP